MDKILSEAIEKSRRYSLEVAEAMPGKQYDFKPAEAVWNFGELMHHMAYTMGWMEDNYVRGIQSNWEPPAVPADKKAIITYLQAAYDHLGQTLAGMKDINGQTASQCYAILEHTAHHRGQGVTYLRCREITPPEYPF